MGAFCSLSLTKQRERVRTAGQTFACFMLQYTKQALEKHLAAVIKEMAPI